MFCPRQKNPMHFQNQRYIGIFYVPKRQRERERKEREGRERERERARERQTEGERLRAREIRYVRKIRMRFVGGKCRPAGHENFVSRVCLILYKYIKVSLY